MRKFINSYKTHSVTTDINENEFVIDSIENLHKFIDIVNEGGGAISWMFNKGKEQFIDAPKVRELQQQANDLRCRAAMEEENFRKMIKDAVEHKKSFDLEKLKQVLIKKKKIYLSTAQEYENQATEIAGTNAYLNKLQRTLRNDGMISANRILLRNATEEETYHLNTDDEAYKNEIEVDLSDINDMLGKRSSDTEHGTREEPHHTGKNDFHKAKNSMEKRAATDKWMDEDKAQIEKRVALFLKQTYRELLNKRLGNPRGRKSANARYDFVNDVIEYQRVHKNVSFEEAYNIIKTDYIKNKNYDIDNPPK